MTAEEILKGLMEVVDFDRVAYDIRDSSGGWSTTESRRFVELMEEARKLLSE